MGHARTRFPATTLSEDSLPANEWCARPPGPASAVILVTLDSLPANESGARPVLGQGERRDVHESFARSELRLGTAG